MSFQDKLEKAVSNFMLPERGGITIMKDKMKPTPPTFREMAEKLLLQLNEDRCGYSAGLVLIEMTIREVTAEARREAIDEVVKTLYANCSKLHCACRHVPEIEALTQKE